MGKAMTYKQHPLSAAFPAMPADEFQRLVDDIDNCGQREPATMFDGMVLDGWHRVRACASLGIAPKTVNLPVDEDPVAWVKSRNLHRRHLNASQRALAVAECESWAPAGRPGNSAPGAEFPATSAKMAKEADTSVRTISQAKVVAAKATSEVKAAVKAGTMSIKAAAETTKPASDATKKPAPKQVKAPEVDDGEIDNLRDTVRTLSEDNTRLGDRLAAEAMDASEEERTAASQTIAELRRENAALRAQLDGVKSQLNAYLVENRELKKSVAFWRRKSVKAAA